jgi:catechol 2,3-dioxygenase-like lactoylglutathione lyase family enzyme
MDWKLELITVPVTDVDRAKAFYVDQAGFHADHDQTVTTGSGSSRSPRPDRPARSASGSA